MTVFRILLVMQLFVCLPGWAKIYTGKVMCAETGKPVEYANVGVVGGSLGTTTNEQGIFSLQLDQVGDDEHLRITCIGFAPIHLKVGDLKDQYTGGASILMHQTQNELKEVTVRPRKARHVRLGNGTKNKQMYIGFDSVVCGKEIGVLMHPKRKPAYIDSVHANVAFCNFDSIFLRLNVYEQIGSEFVNILREPIYVYASSKEALEHGIHVDLTNYNISVNYDFVVSLEYVKNLGATSKMFFCSSMFGGNYYHRSTSQAKLTDVDIVNNMEFKVMNAPAICAYVTY